MPTLKLTVLSLRYSSWSMRAWLPLHHVGASFETDVAELESFETTTLEERRELGSVTGLFPVLRVDGTPIHESLAICETVAELFPNAGLWPQAVRTRARARAICAEMVGGFSAMRSDMPCCLFARAPSYSPSDAVARNIARIREMWAECLDHSGGPFLFGDVSIADFFYYPVLTRFRTYGISLEGNLETYARSLESLPTVEALVEFAREGPKVAVYDDYIAGLGGEADALL